MSTPLSRRVMKYYIKWSLSCNNHNIWYGLDKSSRAFISSFWRKRRAKEVKKNAKIKQKNNNSG
jgi:hypothetical protein